MTRPSASIQATKTVKESMQGRWTDSQMMTTLDHLLMLALEPIIRHTRFLDRNMPAMLCWYATNTGRKISSVDKEKVLHLMNLYLLADSTSDKVLLFKRMRLERNIMFFLIQRFLKLTSEYPKLEVAYAKKRLPRYRVDMEHIEELVGAGPVLGRIVQRVRSWETEATKFRNQILERFMRYAMMQAQRYCAENPRADPEDVTQNFLVAVNKAVNKMNADKGTLAPYAGSWITNAKHSPSHPHEYGIAYSISPHAKRAVAKGTMQLVNISSDFESDEVLNCPDATDEMERITEDDRAARVRKLAKVADPEGYGRRELGIEEVLSASERLLIRSMQQL